ncbi:AraC-like DNA-binding protein [Pseudomonas duriflava]|uniref:AraC-like DNA-binding protein n=1 Tax=Pseudomonas duriflava TaxID=459528 RepID=A0A562PU93_9PSED|nr:AraC family transcriptional regulator [Pseudomonas duriflava]TWI48017.1 AraC-like DNA-binding protein [Pseudomonas duriflava]
MFTVSIGYARLIEETLKAEGLDVGALLKETGLNPGLFNDAARCRVADLSHILMRAVALTGDPGIGLKTYERVRPGLYDVVGHLMMSSPTLACALERFVRFFTLIDNGAKLLLSTEGNVCRLYVGRHGGELLSRPFHDVETVALLAYLRWLCGDPQFRPLQVQFMQVEPADTSGYHSIFQCPIQFGAGCHVLVFNRAELDVPLSADEALFNLHERFAEQRLYEQTTCLSAWRVQQLIRERLIEGEPSIEEISAALYVSKRTLQRCLKREGTQFKDLLNGARREQAHLYLRHSQFSLQKITYLLGFHEHSSFFRACMRWFGMTPGQYRAEASSLSDIQAKAEIEPVIRTAYVPNPAVLADGRSRSLPHSVIIGKALQ